MYDISFKNLKKGLWVGVPVVLIGLLFEGIGLFFTFRPMIQQKFMDAHTQAVTVEFDEWAGMHSPVYTFYVDGISYDCYTPFSARGPVDKSKMTIYYDSKNPDNCVSPYTGNSVLSDLSFLLFPLVFIGYGIYRVMKVCKRIMAIKKLNQTGTLIKQLPYVLVYTDLVVNNTLLMVPQVEVTLPNGETVQLRGDPRYDHKTKDTDGFVDLVIDYQHPENYFIDFEINRIGGNLSTDYSSQRDVTNNINKNNP